MEKFVEKAKQVGRNVVHPRQEHERRVEQRRPLTYGEFNREITALNGSKDSLLVDADKRAQSETYAPELMYHGTSKSNADRILKEGLLISKGGEQGGASHKRGDQEYIKNSKGLIHGTPSAQMAHTYAHYHDQLRAGGNSAGEMSIEDNSAYLGFKVDNPKSINRDPDSQAGYTINQSIPAHKIVRVPNETVEARFNSQNPMPS